MSGAVLVIEDDPNVASSVAMLAKSRGMTATTAPSVAKARSLIGSEWRAMIVDERLPDGSGLDVLEAARGTFAGPALVLTGDESSRVANRAFDLRAKYLVKPATPARIATFLNDAMNDALSRALER